MCVVCYNNTQKAWYCWYSIRENLKSRITANVELENIILPNYKQNFGIGNSSKEFEKVMNAIQDQEDNICKVVRKLGHRPRAEVATQKGELEQKNKSLSIEEKKLNEVINTNNGILKSNDVNNILTYRSKIERFRRDPKQTQISYSMFLSGKLIKTNYKKCLDNYKGWITSHQTENVVCKKWYHIQLFYLPSKLLTKKVKVVESFRW